MAQADRVKMTLEGQWSTTNGPVWSVTVVGQYAYCANGDGGIAILDVSDSTNPLQVGRFITGGYTYDVAVSGNYAYAAALTAGLQVIDISDPSNPQRRGACSTWYASVSVTVSDDYAYVGEHQRGLRAIDISDPSNPLPVGRNQKDFGYAGSVVISGNKAYVSDGNAGLAVIDVSDRTNLPLVGRYDTHGEAHGVGVSGTFAYVGDDEGLQVIDFSNPASPERIGVCGFGPESRVQSVALSGNYAYVADGHTGLEVTDISNPRSPRRVGGYDTTGYSTDVAVSANRAYVADHWGGLLVFGIAELPAIICAELADDLLIIQWNEAAEGMRLQHATNLTKPDWFDLPGSEATNHITLPIWSGTEVFRLMKP